MTASTSISNPGRSGWIVVRAGMGSRRNSAWTLFKTEKLDMSRSQDSVLLEDLSDACPLGQDLAHRVLARHLLQRAADDILFDGGGDHHAAVAVCEDEIAVHHGHPRDGNRAPDSNHLQAALGVGRTHACRK